jgi:hypothetical protein
MTVTVDVQWARYGSVTRSCSSGELNMDNFTELIRRFRIGTPDGLPQVSVSYVPSNTLPGRLYYLGMAIHDRAAGGRRLAERDDDGRPAVVTTYFCIPYEQLADAAVSYQDMYHQLSERRPTASGPPLKVEFPARTVLPAKNPLAGQIASRLLTGQRVCVLGAQSATLAERLEFTDAVAALLPYGFRTRLAMATWVRSTHRDHRFRLWFSDAKRDADPPDDVVHWGHPERTALTPEDGHAYAYDRWLNENLDRPYKELAGLIAPRSFTPGEAIGVFDEIGLDRSQPGASAAGEPSARAAELPEHRFTCEQILRECASHLRSASVPDLTSAITRLKARARQRISPEEQERCRTLMREHHLFRHDEGLGALEGQLRDALFKIAFNPPLSYQDYCLVEDSLGNEPPDLKLLQMIVGAKMSDPRAEAVVYGQLLSRKRQPKLDNWLRSSQMTPAELIVELINAAAGSWDRPRHALYASVAASELANQAHCDPLPIREALQRQRYLAHLLQSVSDGADQAQVYVLYRFLQAAYPDGLGKSDIQQILIENPDPPSPGLLVAILLQPRLWKDQEMARVAREAYVSRVALAMDLDREVREALGRHLVFADERPTGPVRAVQPPGAG